MNATTETTTTCTCQLCGRAIKAGSGRIAKHGYKRPRNQGYETKSCNGTGALPYEVSRDEIQKEIDRANRYIQGRVDYIAEITVNPPAKFQYESLRGSAWDRKMIDVPRPDDFAAAVEIPRALDSLKRESMIYISDRSYLYLWREAYSKAKRDIQATNDYIKFLQARYDAWQAPAAE